MNQHPDLIRAYKIAKEHEGLQEVPGPKHSQEIVDFFRAVGHGWVKDDETAWCAAFVGAMLHEAGLKGTGELAARSYMNWGEAVPLKDARAGDIVVFWRVRPDSWQGHVGFYVGHSGKNIKVLGGNQRNRVGVDSYPAGRLLAVRRLPEPPQPSTEPSASDSKGLIELLFEMIGRIFGRR